MRGSARHICVTEGLLQVLGLMIKKILKGLRRELEDNSIDTRVRKQQAKNIERIKRKVRAKG